MRDFLHDVLGRAAIAGQHDRQPEQRPGVLLGIFLERHLCSFWSPSYPLTIGAGRMLCRDVKKRGSGELPGQGRLRRVEVRAGVAAELSGACWVRNMAEVAGVSVHRDRLRLVDPVEAELARCEDGEPG